MKGKSLIWRPVSKEIEILPKHFLILQKRMTEFSHIAGFSQVDITPDRPLLLSGFASPPGRRGEGCLRPLMAQAAYFEDAEGEGSLVFAVDLIGFDAAWSMRIRRTLSEKTGVPVSRIILNASHTHCGPQTRCEEEFAAARDVDEAYRSRLEESLIAVGMEAYEKREACSVLYGEGVNRQVIYRRLWQEGGWFNRPNPEGEPDRSLPLLSCQWRDGRRLLIAVIAGHPTTASLPLYDPHYQGASRERIKEELGAETELMILSGLSGDSKMTNTAHGGKGWLGDLKEDVRIISLRVVADLLQALPELKPMGRWAFRGATETLALPLWHRPFGDLSPEEAEQKLSNPEEWKAWEAARAPETRPYEIGLFCWDEELRWVVTGGEVCGAYGKLFRDLWKEGQTVVLSYSQSMPSYIPTKRITVEGGYEGDHSFEYTASGVPLLRYHPDIEQCICDGVERLRAALQRRR